MPNRESDSGMRALHGASQGAWLAVVVLIGLNLRPFLTGIGPLVASIRSSTGLDYRGIAWLTLLPMLLMGVAAFFAPSLLRVLGARVTILGALVLLGLGSALRGVAPGGGTLIATAALCGLGVALIQSAFPGLIKREFRDHVAPVTGLYSATLMGGGALGAQLTPLVSDWSGSWRQALAWWSVPVALALVLAWRVLPRHEAPVTGAAPSAALLRRPRTWLLMICFGLVNGGWFAMTLVVALDHLPDHERAGALSALMQGGGFLLAALSPWLVAVLYDATGSFGAGWTMHLAFVTLVFGLTARLAPSRYAAVMAATDKPAAARPR